jgi:hypothetical protein
MSGRNVQRKLGTTRGSLRRSRTAKTSRISCCAVKSRCAHEWGGWGRLSDDGSRQHNSSKSEDPWGSGNPTSWWCTIELTTRHSAGLALDHEVHEGWRQTGGHGVYVGSRLKRPGHPGRHHLKCQPSSRIEENPPYGMIGGIEETSASYEARSAPRSYPTGGGQLPPATRWDGKRSVGHRPQATAPLLDSTRSIRATAPSPARPAPSKVSAITIIYSPKPAEKPPVARPTTTKSTGPSTSVVVFTTGG